jgi:hypothetical protein
MRHWVLPMMAAVAVWGAGADGARAQEAPVVRVFGTVQSQFSTTSVDESDAGIATAPAPTSFEARRIRFGADVRISEYLTGRVEQDMGGGRFQLRSGWLNYRFADAWAVQAGQFKKPFGLIQLTSHRVVPTIERGVRIRGLTQTLGAQDTAGGAAPLLGRLRGQLVIGEQQALLDVLGYQGYDLGAMVHGSPAGWLVQAGVFNGAGPDVPDENARKSLAGRLVRQIGATPLQLGAAVSYRELAVGAETVDGWAAGGELAYGAHRRPGLWLLAEAATGDNLATGGRFVAAQAVATWHHAVGSPRLDGWELVGRASWADPDRGIDGDEALLLTPGVTLYLDSRFRVLANWDVFLPAGDRFGAENSLRVQAQLHF